MLQIKFLIDGTEAETPAKWAEWIASLEDERKEVPGIIHRYAEWAMYIPLETGAQARYQIDKNGRMHDRGSLGINSDSRPGEIHTLSLRALHKAIGADLDKYRKEQFRVLTRVEDTLQAMRPTQEKPT